MGKSVNPLTIEDIYQVVFSFLKDNNKEAIELVDSYTDNDTKMNILLGTPQWTYVQIIDNYYTCKLNKKNYKSFLKYQKRLGLNTLSPKFNDESITIRNFFMFHVYIRPISKEGIKKIEQLVNAEPEVSNGVVYLTNLIKILQMYECTQNPSYTDSDEDWSLIEDQLSLNPELLKHYLDYRADLFDRT